VRHVQMTRLVWVVAVLLLAACLVFAAAQSLTLGRGPRTLGGPRRQPELGGLTSGDQEE
jgi:hypothetical protein